LQWRGAKDTAVLSGAEPLLQKVTFSNFSHFSLYSGRKKGGVFHNRQAGALATCLLIYIYIDIYKHFSGWLKPLTNKDLRV